jgi:hypothetical protein
MATADEATAAMFNRVGVSVAAPELDVETVRYQKSQVSTSPV